MDPNLNDAAFFVEVVERGSFSAAARTSGVPVSTVSRRVARLERRLGVALLTRTTRSLVLTDAGRMFHDHAVRAVAELDVAERVVRSLRERPQGRIRVAAPRGVAALIWPAIAEFLRRFPEVSVDLDAHERPVNLIEERYDLAVRTGALDDSTAIARKLLEGTYGLFASPSYLSERGVPRRVSDLREHECVLVGDRAKQGIWSLRHGSGARKKTELVTVRGRVRVNEMGLAYQATLDGYGIGKLPDPMAAADVRDGRLRRVLPRVDGGPIPAWLIYPATRILSTALRAFVDHMIVRVPELQVKLRRSTTP
jgi:DNA-binding transcriptional LysR family regulator